MSPLVDVREVSPIERGITPSNIETSLKKLKGSLGEEWVSDDPFVLTCYWRDFTHTVGRKPNIVVLPESTEDIQAVLRIAKEHLLPVITMTTGFNHGGCCIPRRGGILIDLKRMNKVLEVDSESMSLKIQPYIRQAAIYAECNKHEGVEGLPLRPANPITMGSVALLSNYVSGGASHTAYKTGNHHENILGMTWVLPDGEILKTGVHAYPGAGNVGVLGPGPDLGGLFLASEGQFGICTEITIKLFNDFPIEKLYMIMRKEEKKGEGKYDLEDVCDLFYKLSRENIAHDFYKAHNRAAAQYATHEAEALLSGQAVHQIMCTLHAINQEELEIKEKRLFKLLEDTEFEAVPDFVQDMLWSAFKMTREEAMRLVFKRCYSLARTMRWKGSFQWVAFPAKFEHIPHLEKRFRQIVKRYFVDPSVDKSIDLAPFGVAMQGPFQLGRFTAFEFDFFVDQGNPEEMARLQKTFEKIINMMLDEGTIVGRVVSGSHDLQMKRLGTYYELVRSLKKELDPDGFMAPDMMPIMEDYV